MITVVKLENNDWHEFVSEFNVNTECLFDFFNKYKNSNKILFVPQLSLVDQYQSNYIKQKCEEQNIKFICDLSSRLCFVKNVLFSYGLEESVLFVESINTIKNVAFEDFSNMEGYVSQYQSEGMVAVNYPNINCNLALKFSPSSPSFLTGWKQNNSGYEYFYCKSFFLNRLKYFKDFMEFLDQDPLFDDYGWGYGCTFLNSLGAKILKF